MRQRRRPPGVPEPPGLFGAFTPRGSAQNFAVIAGLLVAVVIAMSFLRVYIRGASAPPGAARSPVPKTLYRVPADGTASVPADASPAPDALPPEIAEHREIEFQFARDELLGAFRDFSPARRDAVYWGCAYKTHVFGARALAGLAHTDLTPALCFDDPDRYRGDVVRFTGTVRGVRPLPLPPEARDPIPLQEVTMTADLPGGPRTIVIDIPAALPTPPPERMTVAAVFIGLLPADDRPVELPTPETVAASRLYLIGFPAPQAASSQPVVLEGAPAGTPPRPIPAPGPASGAFPTSPPPPLPPTDASLPPLAAPPAPAQAPVLRYEGMLDRIVHDGRFTQDDAYNYFIRFIATTEPSTIAGMATPALTLNNLLVDPKGNSGKIVRMRGIVIRIDHRGLQENPAGVKDSYLAYLVDRDENVIVAHLLEQPPAYASREDVMEVEGIFLKIVEYETERLTKDMKERLVRRSPLVLAKTARIRPASTATPALDSLRWLVVAGIVMAGILAAMTAWFKSRKSVSLEELVARERRKRKDDGSGPGSGPPPGPGGGGGGGNGPAPSSPPTEPSVAAGPGNGSLHPPAANALPPPPSPEEIPAPAPHPAEPVEVARAREEEPG